MRGPGAGTGTSKPLPAYGGAGTKCERRGPRRREPPGHSLRGGTAQNPAHGKGRRTASPGGQHLSPTGCALPMAHDVHWATFATLGPRGRDGRRLQLLHVRESPSQRGKQTLRARGMVPAGRPSSTARWPGGLGSLTPSQVRDSHSTISEAPSGSEPHEHITLRTKKSLRGLWPEPPPSPRPDSL